jgi:hypothetical protein
MLEDDDEEEEDNIPSFANEYNAFEDSTMGELKQSLRKMTLVRCWVIQRKSAKVKRNLKI